MDRHGDLRGGKAVYMSAQACIDQFRETSYGDECGDLIEGTGDDQQ